MRSVASLKDYAWWGSDFKTCMFFITIIFLSMWQSKFGWSEHAEKMDLINNENGVN